MITPPGHRRGRRRRAVGAHAVRCRSSCIFVVFYFLLIRPQQQKAKEQRMMLANLKRTTR